MTGLVQCLLPTSVAALSPNNAPFHHLFLELAILLSNSLPSLLLAAFMYGCWRPYEVGLKCARAGLVIGQAIFMGLLIKYAFAVRHASAPSLDCCMGYVLVLDYSLPSVHAMVAVLVALFVGAPYWRMLQETAAVSATPTPTPTEAAPKVVGEGDIEVNLDELEMRPACTITMSGLLVTPVGASTVETHDLQDARLRLVLIWCYAFAVCSTRMTLHLNNLLDVLFGILLAVAVYYAAHVVQGWMAGPAGAAGVKND